MRPLTAIFLLALSLYAHASELQIFELKHRSAEELIPILQPMLDEDAAITGTGYTLIVRSDDTNRTQIAQLVKQLDKAPQQLLIIVEQDGERQTNRRGFGVSGSSREPNRVQGEIYSNQRNNADLSTQQLRVLEGMWATIRTGSSVPQVIQNYHHSVTGGIVERRVEYRDVDTGFEVRPRLNGNQVTLDIRPFKARVEEHSNVIEQQSLSTTVSGQLGQWIELGGASETGQQSGYGIGGRSEGRSTYGIANSNTGNRRDSHTVRLKVERINH